LQFFGEKNEMELLKVQIFILRNKIFMQITW